jgi:hypothetical protein
MSSYREGLNHWLGGDHRPCERMVVYDRNGVCLGRIKSVCPEDGKMVVSPLLWALRDRHEHRLDAAHCRVHGGAVHTSYAREELLKTA